MRDNPIVYLFRKTWEYSGDNRKKVGLTWTMFLIANTITMFGNPSVWARIMNVVQTQGITPESFNTLLGLLMLTVLLEIVYWSLHGRARINERTYALQGKIGYLSSLFLGVLRLPLDWHVDHHTGETSDKIKNGTGALEDFAANVYILATLFVRLVLSCCILAWFGGWRVALALAITMTLSIYVINRFDRVMADLHRNLTQAGNRLAKQISDTLANISTIITLRSERWVFDSVMKRARDPEADYFKEFRWNEYKWFVVSMCATITAVIVVLIYLRQHLSQKVSAGNVFLLFQYLGQFTSLFSSFADNYGELVKFKTRLENSEELVKNFVEAKVRSVEPLPADWRRLCVENLTFSYHAHDGANLHLANVSFCIDRGTKIAFVGSSGGGKSTMLGVMDDIYSPRNVQMTVDGQPLQYGFAGTGINSAIALVPQKPELLDETVWDNITFGTEVDMGLVRHYTDLACVSGVIDNLPQGFHSSIKEKGVNLSGGEQQRLALARGLLACRDKQIILLDEPTSSVDAVNEMRIHQNILKEFSGRTIISSVHKLHLLRFFDRIIMFDGGQIIASGTLGELLENSPEFQVLWRQYHEHQKRVEDPQGETNGSIC